MRFRIFADESVEIIRCPESILVFMLSTTSLVGSTGTLLQTVVIKTAILTHNASPSARYSPFVTIVDCVKKAKRIELVSVNVCLVLYITFVIFDIRVL